jgi:hypothetical protein
VSRGERPPEEELCVGVLRVLVGERGQPLDRALEIVARDAVEAERLLGERAGRTGDAVASASFAAPAAFFQCPGASSESALRAAINAFAAASRFACCLFDRCRKK